jgi:4-nitrophenyl phosphatase
MAGDGLVPTAVRERLRSARGFVFDLDGTLVLTDRRNDAFTPLPGAVALTRWLAAHGLPFVAFTNGTTKTARGYARALAEAGFRLGDGSVLTPAVSAAELFTRRGYRCVMALGGDGLATPLREAGIEVTPPDGGRPVDAVLAGWYREFSMDALEAACEAVWQGARLYSCSQSVFFATAEGKAIGTSRAISAMIRSVTGCRVAVVGKPSLHAQRSAGWASGPPSLPWWAMTPSSRSRWPTGAGRWRSPSEPGSAPAARSPGCPGNAGLISWCTASASSWNCAGNRPARGRIGVTRDGPREPPATTGGPICASLPAGLAGGAQVLLPDRCRASLGL